MWIERLEIAGFGRLSGDFDLGEGLTVVQGPNESGKSTLHDALVRSMFGFAKSERRLSGGTSVIQGRAPWGGRPFGLVAHVHLAGDRTVRIEWTFGPERKQELVLLDGRTGEDLTSLVAAKGGSYTLGDYLLGVDLESYRQWGCLEQAAGGRVLGDSGLVDALRSASETGSEEAGVDAARALIDAARKSEAIGVHARTGAPLKDRAYALATAREAELREWIAEAEAVQAQLGEEARELERIEAEEAGLRRRIAELEQERLLARRLGLQTTLDRAREAGERAENVDAGAAPEVPAEVANEARSLHGRIEELRAARAEAAARQQAASDELSELLGESGQLDAEIQNLAAYGSVDTSQEGRIGELLGGLVERERAVAAEETGVRGAAGLGDQSVPPPAGQVPGGGAPAPAGPGPGAPGGGVPVDADPEPAADGVHGAPGDPSEWAVPAGIAAASVAGGLLVSPLLFAGLLVAAAAYWWLRERRSGGEGTQLARLRAEREAELARTRAEGEARERSRAEAAARLQELRAGLGAALDQVGATPGDPRSRAEGYLEACRQAGRLAELNARRAGLAERMRTLNEPAGEIQRIDGEVEQRSARLAEVLRSLGIAATGAEAIAELDRMEDAARTVRERRLAVEEAAKSLETILDGREVEEVEASLRDVEGELTGHRAKFGTLDIAPRPEAQVDGDLKVATAARADAAHRLGTARQKVADLEERLTDLPSWRAELKATDERIARIEFAIEALAIADQQLAEAAKEAHRRSVPGLNRAINAELPRITDGRYTQATVDDELQITLVAPETNRAVPADRLSKGTQDQIYLIERLAILELLSQSATEPPPLLLDDAFAHFDHNRRRAALELLAEKSEHRQVVLFVDEPEIAEELESLNIEFISIDLVGPTERVEA